MNFDESMHRSGRCTDVALPFILTGVAGMAVSTLAANPIGFVISVIVFGVGEIPFLMGLWFAFRAGR